MTATIEVSVEAAGWGELEDPQSLAERAIAAALAETGAPIADGAETSLLFCDDAFIQNLNLRWRGFDKPTNVLSFPSGEDPATTLVLGDVALAYETTAREAREAGRTLADHTAHLVVHGFLHLLGYDHEDDEEAEEMEQAERAALARLGIADPYAEPCAESRAEREAQSKER
ncbi:rRNA maturation RNase YbeY [Methylocella sp.]|uniref:rRNA maturation RNase YbeY n=1 Tax=Methylocella sp. TaxID=1978226 RepID=UPI003783F60C